MDSRWPGASRSARVTVLIGALALMYGTVVHIVHLIAGGWNPYPDLPGWLAAYFISLTVMDPLAAVLLLRGAPGRLWRGVPGRLSRARRAGLVLGCAVLLSDSAANGYATYVLDDVAGVTVQRIGHAVVTILAVAFTVAAVRLWPVPVDLGASAPPGTRRSETGALHRER